MGPVATMLLCWLGAGVALCALLGGWRRYPEAGEPVTTVTAPTVTPTVTLPPVTRDASAASRSKRYRERKRKRKGG